MSKHRTKKYNPIRTRNYIIYPFREVVDYQSYNDILFQILSQNCLSPFLFDGRIRFNDGRDNSKYRLSDLAYACYNGDITSFETWKNEMQVFLDRKLSGAYQIDHADSNVHNNTILNLSMMDGEANRAKASKVRRFKPPLTVAVAYMSGEYRVHAEWSELISHMSIDDTHIQGKSIINLNLLCCDEWALVSCLDELSFLETDWSYPVKIKNRWIHSEQENPYADARISISMQECLANMEREDLNLYRPGQLKERLKPVGVKPILFLGDDRG